MIWGKWKGKVWRLWLGVNKVKRTNALLEMELQYGQGTSIISTEGLKISRLMFRWGAPPRNLVVR